MALLPTFPTIDISKLNLNVECATAPAKAALNSAVDAMKGILDGLTAGADGLFSAGGTLLADIQGNINNLIGEAEGAIGEATKELTTLKGSIAGILLDLEQAGAAGLAEALLALKDLEDQFPTFDLEGFLGDIQLPDFDLCQAVPNLTIFDGQVGPVELATEVQAALRDAVTSIPDPLTIPLPPIGPLADELAASAKKEFEKLASLGQLFGI